MWRLDSNDGTAANADPLLLVDLGKKSAALMEYIHGHVRETHRPFENGGVLATASLPVAAAGAAAVASFNAGNVFVTAAAPSTLMSAGSNAVYSAVVAPTGRIVGMAPFVPATLPSVVAPLLLFNVFFATVTLIGYLRTAQELASLQKEYRELLRRDWAEDWGGLLAVLDGLEDLRAEHRNGLRFTHDMQNRLGTLVKATDELRHKYTTLSKSRHREGATSTDDVTYRAREMLVLQLARRADVEVACNRLLLALQSSWADVERRHRLLKDKRDAYVRSCHDLAKSNPVSPHRKALETLVNRRKRRTRYLSKNLNQRLNRNREEELTSLRVHEKKLADVARNPVPLELAEREPSALSMIFWKEKDQIQAYHTSDVSIEVGPHP